jgi:hypothetical protein
MNPEELDQLAERANQALADNPDFSSCTVHSYDPPVLAYHCVSGEAASKFQFERELQGMRAEVDPDDTESVLEYR